MDLILILSMLPTLLILLLLGVPVAFALIAVSFLSGGLGVVFDVFDPRMFSVMPSRLYGIMINELLIAIPLFIFMGLMLEKSRLAEELLETMGALFGNVRGGMAVSVSVVGGLLAASTGVVGAAVVSMGLMSLPVMLKHGYSKPIACGSICAAGTLGQIIPPSILLILLTDQISSAYRVAQSNLGNMAPESISVIDIFAGALVPGVLLMCCYITYQLGYGLLYPKDAPAVRISAEPGRKLFVRVLKSLVPPLLLIIAVLGSLLGGVATATEAASVGAVGAMLLALVYSRLSLSTLNDTSIGTMKLTAMIFMILIGATFFALMFRSLGGTSLVDGFLTEIPGGKIGALLMIMVVVFLLGFVLDFIEIMVIVIPIIGPTLFMMDVHPIWFAILLSVNLQTSFLTPPFGFSLFYLQGVAPIGVHMGHIYRGVMPFIFIQLLVLCMIWFIPEIATWLPDVVYGRERTF